MSTAAMTATPAAEFRAAGTDLQRAAAQRRLDGTADRYRRPRPTRSACIGARTARLRIGAFTTIAAIAADARIAAAYPGIAASAQGLATPQIRHLATLGGNLAQRSRCWYFRNPHIACLKKGGIGLPGAIGQSSLWRRLRSRPLRRAASLDHGGGAAGL